MKFIDECNLNIIAGKGGNGIVSFLRLARMPKGGPDGGDGGDGGSIYFQGNSGMNTLISLQKTKLIKADNGKDGKNKNKYGAKGKDIVINVPFGTIVFFKNNIIADVKNDKKKYLIAKGGKGGKGNNRFKSSINSAPRICENGLPGEKKRLKLVLKVLADIGLVGNPSVGKSTIISKISNAKPKIASYEFTTLIPQLGLVKVDKEKSFVVADLPGLIKGAAQGKGLGNIFLKHIERCRVIAHILDFSQEISKIIKDFRNINQELDLFNIDLKKRSMVIVANKIDINPEQVDEKISKFQKIYNYKIIKISALKEINLKTLIYNFFQAFQNAKKIINKTMINKEITITLEDDIIVEKASNDKFNVYGEKIKHFYQKIPLNTTANFKRFRMILNKIGLNKILIQKNIKNGDTVQIFDYEFEWNEES